MANTSYGMLATAAGMALAAQLNAATVIDDGFTSNPPIGTGTWVAYNRLTGTPSNTGSVTQSGSAVTATVTASSGNGDQRYGLASPSGAAVITSTQLNDPALQSITVRLTLGPTVTYGSYTSSINSNLASGPGGGQPEARIVISGNTAGLDPYGGSGKWIQTGLVIGNYTAGGISNSLEGYARVSAGAAYVVGTAPDVVNANTIFLKDNSDKTILAGEGDIYTLTLSNTQILSLSYYDKSENKTTQLISSPVNSGMNLASDFATGMRFALFTDARVGTAQTATATFDRFEVFTTVPEPASLGLMALAGLSLLGRRARSVR